MSAEPAAIHVALDKYKDDPWIGIFTDSKTSLHVIQHELERSSNKNYHHHKPRIAAIVSTLRYLILLGISTILHKIRRHTHIRGNETTVKRVETSFEDISGHQNSQSL